MPKKQKSGLYRARIKVGVKPDGSDDYKYISGKTKKELEDARRQVVEYFIEGKKTAADRRFGLCAQDWFARLEEKVGKGKKSLSTLDSYRTALNKDILPVFGDRHMRAIDAQELQSFIDGFDQYSKTKITYVTAALKGVFEIACKDGILQQNPIQHIEKPAGKEGQEKRALTEDERRRVIAVATTHEKGAYIACMYFLGARPGEIRGLQWGDFDWGRGLVHIQRDIDYKKKGTDKVGALKNTKSNRFVPVPDQLKDILYPLRQEPDRFVFEGDVNKSCLAKTSAERLWVELMLACDMVEAVSSGENNYRGSDVRSLYKPIITPHTMRHNYVTMCWENGVDVYTCSKLVGHKSIKTTMDIYTHLSEKQMSKAVSEVARMFST